MKWIEKATALPKYFEHWLCEPSDAFSLGFSRFVFYSYVAVYFLLAGPSRPPFLKYPDGAVGPEELWIPIAFFESLGFVHPPSPGLLSYLTTAWCLSMMTSAIGLLTRISTGVSFLTSFYLLAVEQSYGHTHHRFNLVVQVMLVLALCRCGDAFSLDSLYRKRRGHLKISQGRHYGWPKRLIQILFVYMFFAAGVTKVWRSKGQIYGLMTYVMSWRLIHTGPSQWSMQKDILDVFNQTPFLRHCAGIGTLILELGAPLALRNSWSGHVMLVALCLFQFVVYLVMGIKFFEYLGVYAFFINWSRLFESLKSQKAQTTSQMKSPP